jgi:hypothetical protein
MQTATAALFVSASNFDYINGLEEQQQEEAIINKQLRKFGTTVETPGSDYRSSIVGGFVVGDHRQSFDAATIHYEESGVDKTSAT